jgi:hypothetical protein
VVKDKPNVRNQEAVIRLFDNAGHPLTADKGFQDTSSAGLAIPVWRTTYSTSATDKREDDMRIVDLATSAWVDSGGSSKYGFVILVAAIATAKASATVVTNTDVPDPGEVLIVSGVRACRKQ